MEAGSGIDTAQQPVRRRLGRRALVIGLAMLLSMTWAAARCASSQGLPKAVLVVPRVVNLAVSTQFPIHVEVTTPEGQPYTGEVALWGQSARFVAADGALVDSPFMAQVTGGELDVVASLADHIDGVPPFTISVTREDAAGLRQALGAVEVTPLYPESLVVLEGKSTFAARADGVASPRAVVLVLDQFGKPLPRSMVKAHVWGHGSADTRVSAQTDDSGVAVVALPTESRPGYALCQLQVGALTSDLLTVVYTNDAPAMVPLRQAAALGTGSSVSRRTCLSPS